MREPTRQQEQVDLIFRVLIPALGFRCFIRVLGPNL